MRVLVCGSRHYTDADHVCNVLGQLQPQPTVIISGGARGVDKAGEMYADGRASCTKEVYPADWEKHGKAAGPIRNTQMLKEGKPDLVIAFLGPSSRGTANMIDQATKAGIPVKVVNI